MRQSMQQLKYYLACLIVGEPIDRRRRRAVDEARIEKGAVGRPRHLLIGRKLRHERGTICLHLRPLRWSARERLGGAREHSDVAELPRVKAGLQREPWRADELSRVRCHDACRRDKGWGALLWPGSK
jgi:hypothetical protein